MVPTVLDKPSIGASVYMEITGRWVTDNCTSRGYETEALAAFKHQPLSPNAT
jgi:hypothetical protein